MVASTSSSGECALWKGLGMRVANEKEEDILLMCYHRLGRDRMSRMTMKTKTMIEETIVNMSPLVNTKKKSPASKGSDPSGPETS